MVINNSTYIHSIKRIASELPVDEGVFLVTGASGLIGSCVVDVLSAANLFFHKHLEIYAMGRDAEKLNRRFGITPDVHCVVQNVTDAISIEGINYIIHAASNADPISYAKFPVETILTNVVGAKNVLDYCKTNKTRVLLTSTFEVYGKLDQDTYGENEYGLIDLGLLRSCYPESKRTAEMLSKSYYDEYGVDCVIARLASIYGPTMQTNDSKAHAQFLRNALAGKRIVLKSKGTQKRTY